METYWRWEQDPALLVGYGRQQPESLEARTEGMVHQLRGDNIRFTVYDLATGSPVPAGVATLLPDSSVRTAEYVVMLAPRRADAAWARPPPGWCWTTRSTSPTCGWSG